MTGTTGRRAIVIATEDGGSTWHMASLATAGLGNDPILIGVSCPTVRFCLAVGGEMVPSTFDQSNTYHPLLFATRDGGRSWQRRGAPSGLSWAQGVTCTSEAKCLVSGQSDDPLNGNLLGIIVATENGGSSWLEYPPSFAQDVQSVSCGAGSACVATGLGNGVGFGAKSLDSGKTWRQFTLPFESDAYGVACAPGGSCWATWGGLAGAGGSDPSDTGGVLKIQ